MRPFLFGDYYTKIVKNPFDKKVSSRVRNMTATERVFARAGANAEDISVAASRAQGMQYDGEKEVEAYEYGLEQRKNGNGQDLDLLIEATDYLDSTGESEYNILNVDDIHIGRSVGASAKNYPVKGKGSSRQHYKFAEGTDITDIKVIMGYGTNYPLADIYNIASANGIKNPYSIQKLQGKGWIVEDGEKIHVLLHWYRAYGEDEYYSFKIKEVLNK